PPHTHPPHTRPPHGGHHHPHKPSLPDTGGQERLLLGASAAGAVLIAAGAVLYRRGRAASRR
ncbi:LPXTG cell wall anchor domain-containing protein, partial [Streptomyces sp. SID4985]|uniref:LPXTG cell wall anchor domain-containing protein n=2 Tax=unclassified Streptomyces TaxID=2593676 RepID=UPI00136DE432